MNEGMESNDNKTMRYLVNKTTWKVQTSAKANPVQIHPES